MMHLDVPTLMIMGSFIAACSGVVLFIAWLGERKIAALALWGTADLLSAVGIFCLMLGMAEQAPPFSIAGGNLLALSHGLFWRAARALDGKPAPIALVLLGTAALIVAGLVPDARPMAASLGLSINAAYLLAAAISLWHGRAERLPARLPLIGFTLMQGAVMLIGACSTIEGTGITHQVPPLMSLFGVVHFATNIFSVGAAVFLLALVRERSEAETRIAARIDSLTGIANRAAFKEAAERIIENCRQEKAPVSVIMFDLDRFKAINDSYGHAVGDDVIRKFCEVTQAALRPCDIFGRLGGEEFAVVLPCSSIEPAYVRAERIRAGFAETCRSIGQSKVNATVSGGVAVSVEGESTLSELLEYSDDALYGAKAAGRNRIKRSSEQIARGDGASAFIRVA